MAQIYHVGIALFTGVTTVILTLGGCAAQLCEKSGVLCGSHECFLAEGLIGLQQRSQFGQVRE